MSKKNSSNEPKKSSNEQKNCYNEQNRLNEQKIVQMSQ